MTERSLVLRSRSIPIVLSNMLLPIAVFDDEPTDRVDDTDSCTRSRLLPRLPDLDLERERDRPRLALPDLDLERDLDLEGHGLRPRLRDLERDRRLTAPRTCLLREADSAAAISVMRRLKRPCEM